MRCQISSVNLTLTIVLVCGMLHGVPTAAQSSWSPIGTDTAPEIPGLETLDFWAVDKDIALLATSRGIYRIAPDSSSGALRLSATLTDARLPSNAGMAGGFVRSFSDTIFFTNGPVAIRSTDRGNSWHQFSVLRNHRYEFSFYVAGLFLARNGMGEWVTYDVNGAVVDTVRGVGSVTPDVMSFDGHLYSFDRRWIGRWEGDLDFRIGRDVAMAPTTVLELWVINSAWMIGNMQDGVYLTTDSGKTWSRTQTESLYDVAPLGDGSLVAQRSTHREMRLGITEVVRSIDSGRTWSVCSVMPAGHRSWIDRNGDLWWVEGAALLRRRGCTGAWVDTVRGFFGAHVLDVAFMGDEFVASVDRRGMAISYDAPSYELYYSEDGQTCRSIDKGVGRFIGVDSTGRIYVVRETLTPESREEPWKYTSISYVQVTSDRGITWDVIEATEHEEYRAGVRYELHQDEFGNVILERILVNPLDKSHYPWRGKGFFLSRPGADTFEVLASWSDSLGVDVVDLRGSAGRFYHQTIRFNEGREIFSDSIVVLDSLLNPEYVVDLDPGRREFELGGSGAFVSWQDASSGMYRTTDRGASWESILWDGEPINGSDFQEITPETYVVATPIGTILSRDAGTTWYRWDWIYPQRERGEWISRWVHIPPVLGPTGLVIDTIELSRTDLYGAMNYRYVDTTTIRSNTILVQSQNFGMTWNYLRVNLGIEDLDVTAIERNERDRYVLGTRSNGLFSAEDLRLISHVGEEKRESIDLDLR